MPLRLSPNAIANTKAAPGAIQSNNQKLDPTDTEPGFSANGRSHFVQLVDINEVVRLLSLSLAQHVAMPKHQQIAWVKCAAVFIHHGGLLRNCAIAPSGTHKQQPIQMGTGLRVSSLWAASCRDNGRYWRSCHIKDYKLRSFPSDRITGLVSSTLEDYLQEDMGLLVLREPGCEYGDLAYALLVAQGLRTPGINPFNSTGGTILLSTNGDIKQLVGTRYGAPVYHAAIRANVGHRFSGHTDVLAQIEEGLNKKAHANKRAFFSALHAGDLQQQWARWRYLTKGNVRAYKAKGLSSAWLWSSALELTECPLHNPVTRHALTDRARQAWVGGKALSNLVYSHPNQEEALGTVSQAMLTMGVENPFELLKVPARYGLLPSD